jgi:anthranilate phosphoribosyltransferase
MVVHGNGLDEITISGPTRVAEIRDGSIRDYTLVPRDAGIRTSQLASITGSTPMENARIIRKVLAGRDGPARDVVVLNAGAAIYLGGRAPGYREGVSQAQEAIDSGAANEKLEALVAATGGRS